MKCVTFLTATVLVFFSFFVKKKIKIQRGRRWNIEITKLPSTNMCNDNIRSRWSIMCYFGKYIKHLWLFPLRGIIVHLSWSMVSLRWENMEYMCLTMSGLGIILSIWVRIYISSHRIINYKRKSLYSWSKNFL